MVGSEVSCASINPQWAIVSLYLVVTVESLWDANSAFYTLTARLDGSGNITARCVLLLCFFCLFSHACVGSKGLSPHEEVRPLQEPTCDATIRGRKHARFEAQLIHNAASRGDVQSAEQSLKMLKRRGTIPDVVCYNGVIHACSKANDPVRAEAWIQKMQRRNVEPDVLSYTGVIRAHAKHATKDSATRAEYWLDRMIAAGVRPNQHSFTAVINAYGKASDVGGAVRAFARMKDVGETGNVFVYTSLLDACARAGDARLATCTLELMRADGVSPNVNSYEAAARALAVHGDYLGVEALLREMKGERVEPNGYFIVALIAACGNATPPQPSRARGAVRDAISGGIPVIGNHAVFRALAACCGKSYDGRARLL